MKKYTVLDNTVPKKVLYSNYKRTAEKRLLVFELSFEDFITLTAKNCFYCSSSPSNYMNAHSKSTEYPLYYYNGIDRVDNSIGYTLENCVPCCKICNSMKGKLTQQEFIAQCERIINNV